MLQIYYRFTFDFMPKENDLSFKFQLNRQRRYIIYTQRVASESHVVFRLQLRWP